jgi:hypothetical protein
MVFHFTVHGGWLTASVDPVADFLRPEVSSCVAQTYKSITVQVHAKAVCRVKGAIT